ncbi:MAG: sensor domain-containing diguanylate cyclase [Firmicutes bacterium]|nr:sensor domain-containing diguanylate cyclase [Bacillota bacterium]
MNLGTLISTYWWALTAAALLVISYLSWKLFHLSKQVAVEMDRIERALTASKACYWEWSVGSCIVKRSGSCSSILGCTDDSCPTVPFFQSELIHEDDIPRIKDAVFECVRGASSRFSVQYRLKTADVKWKWILDRGAVISYENDKPVLIAGLTIDISSLKAVEQELKTQSYIDPVTGLYNRAYFEKQLNELDNEKNLPLSVIVGDLNGLKWTNDVYGHKTGDDLIIEMADVLRRTCRKTDIITRWGGDEFIILMPNTTREEAKVVCNRIRENCRYAYSDGPIPLSVALGTATKENTSDDLRKILRTADLLMYDQKRKEKMARLV